MKIKVNASSHQESKVGEILICFSAYTNTKKIFSTKSDAATIPVIHGLKPLSMCCIIIFHTVYYNIEFFGKYNLKIYRISFDFSSLGIMNIILCT